MEKLMVTTKNKNFKNTITITILYYLICEFHYFINLFLHNFNNTLY